MTAGSIICSKIDYNTYVIVETQESVPNEYLTPPPIPPLTYKGKDKSVAQNSSQNLLS